MTLRELLDSRPALGFLISQPIPITVALSLRRTVKAINSELETYTETQKALCVKHGVVTETPNGGWSTEFKPEEKAAFEQEYQELIAAEITIPGQMIKAEVLAGISITTADLLALSWLITE